jgi:8-oxo-dGTP pyrophosphatase MutT (NUDIX family)
MPSPEQARLQLIEAIDHGLKVDFSALAPGTRDQAVRSSAVLILFGALDRVDADSSVQTVSPALDVLLTRRADGMRHHPGQIAFPGGGCEPEDRFADGSNNYTVTALREAHEETGLEPDGVEVIGQLPELYIPVSKNLVTPVLGWWNTPSEVSADEYESVEVFRVPVGELLDPDARGVSVLTRAAHTYRSPAFQLRKAHGGHLVWGFTAMVLDSLFDQLSWTVPWSADHEFPV